MIFCFAVWGWGALGKGETLRASSWGPTTNLTALLQIRFCVTHHGGWFSLLLSRLVPVRRVYLRSPRGQSAPSHPASPPRRAQGWGYSPLLKGLVTPPGVTGRSLCAWDRTRGVLRSRGDQRSQIAHHRSHITDHRSQIRLQITDQITGHRSQIAHHRVAGVAGSPERVTQVGVNVSRGDSTRHHKPLKGLLYFRQEPKSGTQVPF